MLTDFFLSAGKIGDFSNADVAVDQYHRYEVSSAFKEGIITRLHLQLL